jgi:hypothetical protein
MLQFVINCSLICDINFYILYLLNYIIPRGVRTSLPLALWLRGVSPTTMLPAPSPCADGAAGRSTASARHPTPRLSTSPSLGVDGMPRQAGTTPVHPSPLLLASPFTGVDGRLCREGGTQLQSVPLPADPTLSTPSPSWTSVVRDGTSSGSPPASQREEFFCLYECCVASGLRAHVKIRNGTGFQEIPLSCCLQTTPIAAASRP